MIFRPSGGLVYHWRAARERARWEPFERSVAAWLREWDCPREELVLIGPSGGYTVPDEFLRRFDARTAYDLDPLARFFFRRRHPGAPTKFVRRDAFARRGLLSVAPMKEILAAHPRAAFLFCNVLGQLPLEIRVDERGWADFLLRLREALKGRRWASYHDRASAHGRARVDHLTGGRWTGGLDKKKLRWEMGRGRRHLVEAVRV